MGWVVPMTVFHVAASFRASRCGLSKMRKDVASGGFSHEINIDLGLSVAN